ncbi:sugar ABC transporter substrate-binding protein [Lachnospiraceae bacterium]|nr:sugar ABC transporter substrate-binding protein [Lachnospiraceae bacterium]
MCIFKEMEKNMKIKKILTIGLAVAMAVATMTGCGNTAGGNAGDTTGEASGEAAENQAEEKATEDAEEAGGETASGEAKWKLGYSSLAFFDEGCKRIADGFTDHEGEFPEFEISVLDGNSDINTQMENIDAFWTNDVDVIAIQAYPGIEANLKKFYEAGKPIIFVDFYPVITDDIKDMEWYYVGSGDYQMGCVQGEYLAEVLPENGKVCEVIINVGQKNSIDRSDGLHETLEKLRPDVEIIDTQPGLVDTTTTMNVVEDWLQRFGDDGIDAITSQSVASTAGIIEVLKAHNLTEDIYVVSGDETPETAQEWIGNGWLDATAYFDLQDMSVKAMEIAKECMNGNPPEQKEYLMERKIYTKDNLDEYGK